MPNVALKCPHCLTERAGFVTSPSYFSQVNTHDHIFLLQCGVCREGVVAKIRCPYIGQWMSGQAAADSAQIVDTWPKASPPSAPNHVPDNVKGYYLQGMDNLSRRNWDAAGTMYRKALDIGIKKIHTAGRGNLKERINSIPEATGITPAMKEWAHNIRDLGNDAAHEEEPFTEEEAKALQSFTELFLTYAFTLPGMIEARRPPAA